MFECDEYEYDPAALEDPASRTLELELPAPTRGLARWAALVARSPRLVVLVLVWIAILALLALRLHRLQIVEAQLWTQRSEEQSAQLVRLPAPRGIIYSRDGESLVRNMPTFQVYVIPAYLPEDQVEEERVLRRVAQLINRPYEEIREMVDYVIEPGPSYAPYDPLVIGRQVERNLALTVEQERLMLPGVGVEVQPRRQYPYGSLVAQVVGYMGAILEYEAEEYEARGYDISSDQKGHAGVEASYEEWLRGIPGERYQEEDVMGRPVRILQEEQPMPGHNVYLTLDLGLQQVTQSALQEALTRYNSRRGVAIAMDPNTGEIMAMVSLPTYDNNLFAQGISTEDYARLTTGDMHRPLINHAISDHLPPGSIFKIIPASAALEEGVVTPRTRLLCPPEGENGQISLPHRYAPDDPSLAQPFYCWNRGGHGWLNVVDGLTQSCDVFFYKVGGGFEEDNFEGLGIDRLVTYSRLFGLGSPTGIDLPGEAAGLVPDPDWKRLNLLENWTTGDTYIMSIGQGGLETTPLQMLNVMAATANGGTLYRPQIVHHITDAEGEVVRPFQPVVSRTLPIADENWSLVVQGLEGAVAHGTATGAQVDGVRVAGKTGTAQFCDNIALETGICGVGLEQPTHAWFMAFAPVEAPEIAVIVFVYNGGEGSTVAVPVAQEILDWYFHHDEVDEETPAP